MKTQKKLSLRKEKVSTLSKETQIRITGGEMAGDKTAPSSEHRFTCCWCTGGVEFTGQRL